MAQVWNALNSLSRTMRDRGGISDAMLRGADATLGLKRAEYEIGRGVKADALAERGMVLREGEASQRNQRWGLELPELEAKAKEAAYQNEEININAKDVIPPNQSGFLHTFTPRTKDGKSLFDDMNEGLEGSGWDDKTGNRIRSDGSPVTMPRWKWEQKYKPAMMFTYLSKTDPVKLMNDKIFEAKQALDASPPGTAEYTQRKVQYDKMNSAMGDKVQMASLYGKKVEAISEGIAWGIANNADPKYLSMLSGELTDSRNKFDKYSTQLTDAEKLKIKELTTNIAHKEAETKKLIAETESGGRKKGDTRSYQKGDQQITEEWTGKKWDRLGIGEKWQEKELSVRDRRGLGNDEVERFMGQYNITKDINGMMISGLLSKTERDAIEADGKRRDLYVYFEPQTYEDTGVGFWPFDNKDVEAWTVRKVVPTEDFGKERQGVGQLGADVAPNAPQSWKQYLPVNTVKPTVAQPAIPVAQPQNDIAGLGYEGLDTQSAPVAPSSELIPGMRGNVAAFNRSLEEAARALGLRTKEEAAQQLATFIGVPVESVNSMQPNKLAMLINAVIAAQAEASKGLGNIQPYGIR